MKDRDLHHRIMLALVKVPHYTAESRADGATVYHIIPDGNAIPERKSVGEITVNENFQKMGRSFVCKIDFTFVDRYPVSSRAPVMEAVSRSVREYPYAEVLHEGDNILFINKRPEGLQ